VAHQWILPNFDAWRSIKLYGAFEIEGDEMQVKDSTNFGEYFFQLV
jgi:hypothetical protein